MTIKLFQGRQKEFWVKFESFLWKKTEREREREKERERKKKREKDK